MYPFNVYRLPSLNNDVLKHLKKHGIETSYSRFYCQAQIENGFNVYIHKTKDKMEFVNDPKFRGKNFFYVVNPFEHALSSNNKSEKDDINTSSNLYFNIDNESSVKIKSRAFFKLWEILMIFDPFSKGSIVTAHLAEAPGSFVQATMFYREKFFREKDYNNDEHYTISLDDDNSPTFKKEFKKAYNKVKIYEQDGGDLTSIQSINKFSKYSKKADFITADGGFDWLDENMQEQEAYRLILGEIITALKIQKDGGTFVLKMFEIYTNNSIKFLCILSALYDEIYIYKPYTSRPSNSEKYIICKSFKGVSNDIIEILTDLLKEMNDKHENHLELANFMSTFEIPIDFKNIINYSSIKNSNTQFEMINKMVSFINSNNYYGEQYHNYLREQQIANDFWIQLMFPIDTLDLMQVRNIINNHFNNSMTSTDKEIKQYVKSLII